MDSRATMGGSTGLQRRSWHPLVIAAALVVVVGIGVGIAAMLGGSGGSASPAAAVTGFVEAFEARNLSAAVSYIDPPDRPLGNAFPSFGNAARGNLGYLAVHSFSIGTVAEVGNHSAVVVYGTVCVPDTPCENVDALLAAVSSSYDQYFQPAGPSGPTGVAAIPCVDDGGWYVYGGTASWVPVLIHAALSAPRSPASTTLPMSLPPLTSAVPSTASSIPVTTFAAPAAGQPGIVAAGVLPGATSLSLPEGAPVYLYGFATGGALPASAFVDGTVGTALTSRGITAAGVAMTPSDTDSYTTSATARAIAGVALEGFGHTSIVLSHNSAPGASEASVSLSVTTPGSLVVVIGLAAGEQSITLVGLPGMQVVTQAPSSSPVQIVIASAVLEPGNYIVSENTSPLLPGTDPANDADLIAAVIATPAT